MKVGHTPIQNPSPQPRAYLRVGFLDSNGKCVTVKGLVDSGNLTAFPAAMSSSFARQLGLKIHQVKMKIGTASTSGTLQVEGICLDVRMAISKSTIVNLHKVLIIRDLNGPLNLSLKFLEDTKSRIDFNKQRLMIKGESIPIIGNLKSLPGTGIRGGGTSGPTQMELGGDGLEPFSSGEEGMEPLLPISQISQFAQFHELNELLANPSDIDINKDVLNNMNSLNIEAECPSGYNFPNKISNLGPASHFANSTKLGIKVKGKRVVLRKGSRNVVTLEALHQRRGHEMNGRLHVKQSHILQSNTVTVVTCLLDKDNRHKNKIVFVSGADATDDAECQVSEGVYRIESDGSVKILVGNTTDNTRGLARGRVFSCQLLTPTQMKVHKARLAEGKIQEMSETTTTDELAEEDLEDVIEETPEFERLWKELKMDNNEILNQNPDIRLKARRLIHDYVDIFSYAEPGETDLVELDLKLQPGAAPVRQKVRPLNPAMEADLQKQLDAWLEQGVIETSDSPWSSPLVPVRKKDGTVRWAVDYRRVNQVLEQDAYPLPRIQTLLEKAGGHQVYSTLDQTQAYFNIRIAEKSRKITAFATPNGLYQFRKMPFGLSVAPAVYSRFIAAALNRLGTRGINVYLDDVLVFSRTLTEHLHRMREVFQVHRDAGVKLKPSKTFLFQRKVEYLGHMLSADGISMVDKYIERIMEWPSPKTPKELNTLLGFFGYYRQFIPAFASLTAEMNEHKKKQKLEWSSTMEESLKKLKAEFKKEPIRAPPQFENPAPFQLTTDYSSTAIAAILSQQQDGAERLIGAVGRKTTGPEKRYPSWKGELAAIMYGIRKFAPILSYRRFTINTDSKALTYFNSLKCNAGMVSRWAEELQAYDFVVVHRPGKLNCNADSLSRRVDMPEPEPQEEEEQAQYVGRVNALSNVAYQGSLQRDNLFKEQAEDDILKMVRIWICQERLPERKDLRGLHQEAQQYAQIFETLKIGEDGILMQEMENALGPVKRILVPDKLRDAVFKMSHQHASAGHFGVTASISRVKKNFYYPNLHQDVRTRVATCLQCLAKVTKEKRNAGIHVPQKCGYPCQTLFVDLVGPLPQTNKGHNYIMSVQDGYSRYISLYPLVTKEARGVVDTLVNEWIKQFGCPGRIHSDNGTEFVNQLMAGMNSRLDILHTRGPPYNPQSNQVERFHSTLAAMLRVLLPRADTEWDQHLPAITMAYNTKTCQATGVTPSLAFLGREAKLPVDLIIRTPDAEFETQDHGVRSMLSRYNNVFRYYAKQQEGSIRRNAKRYLGSARYETGDVVWYLSSRRVPGKPDKITNQWVGPWLIVCKIAEVLYKIEPRDPGSPHKPMVVNISRLKKMIQDPNQQRIPTNIHFDEEENEDAEELYSEAPRTSIHIPVYTPTHTPLIRDVGDSSPRQQDRAEEELNNPRQPQEVQDAVTPTIEVDPPEAMEEAPVAGPSRGEAVKRGSGSPEAMEEATVAAPSRGETVKRGREVSSPDRNYGKRHIEEEEENWEVSPTSVNRDRGLWRRFKENVRNYESAVAAEDVVLPSSDDEMGEPPPPQLNALCIPMKKGARTPCKAAGGATRYNMYSPATTELPPGQVTAIDLGLTLALPVRHYLELASLNKLTNRGITLISRILTSDTRGNITPLFRNDTDRIFTIEQGQRCCQGALISYG